MSAYAKLLAAVALVAAIEAAWLARMELIIAKPEAAAAYELDRWTSVYFVTPSQ
jgi:hypothetical protein